MVGGKRLGEPETFGTIWAANGLVHHSVAKLCFVFGHCGNPPWIWYKGGSYEGGAKAKTGTFDVR